MYRAMSCPSENPRRDADFLEYLMYELKSGALEHAKAVGACTKLPSWYCRLLSSQVAS